MKKQLQKRRLCKLCKFIRLFGLCRRPHVLGPVYFTGSLLIALHIAMLVYLALLIILAGYRFAQWAPKTGVAARQQMGRTKTAATLQGCGAFLLQNFNIRTD